MWDIISTQVQKMWRKLSLGKPVEAEVYRREVGKVTETSELGEAGVEEGSGPAK